MANATLPGGRNHRALREPRYHAPATLFRALALLDADVWRFGGGAAGCVAAAGVAALLAWQWRSAGWGNNYLALAGALPAVFLLAFSLVSSRGIFDLRYLVFAQLHWLCAAAATVANCRGALVRGAAAGALALFSLGACADCWPELGPSANADMRGAAAYIREHRRPNEMVVARGSNVFFELSYYLRGDGAPLLAVERRDRTGMFGSAHLADDELITFAGLAARRPAAVWLVDSPTFAGVASKNMAPTARSQWQALSQESFASDFRFEQPIVVSYLRPRYEGRRL